jgi:hypothetical protein
MRALARTDSLNVGPSSAGVFLTTTLNVPATFITN